MSTTKTLEKAELYSKPKTNRIIKIKRALLATAVLVSGFAIAGCGSAAVKDKGVNADAAAEEVDLCPTCPKEIAMLGSKGAQLKTMIGENIADNYNDIAEKVGHGKGVTVEVELTVEPDGTISRQKLTAFSNGVRCPGGKIDKLVSVNLVGKKVDAPINGCCRWRFSVP